MHLHQHQMHQIEINIFKVISFAEMLFATGASLTALIVSVTVAVLESCDPLFTLYVNESEPL